MIIIAAMGRNRVIGSGERLPWDVPQEYAQFLEFIAGQTVIIGRRSWQIFGPDLTSAHNIVVSRSARQIEGATVAGSLEVALEVARGLGKRTFCAGGASIYAQAIPLARCMFLSYIKGEFLGDAYFPEFDESEWAAVDRKDHPSFDFVVYERKPGAGGPAPCAT